MKILITTDLYTTATNGVVTSVRNLYEELLKLGHEVRILTFSDTSESSIKGDVYYLGSAPFNIYPEVRRPRTFGKLYVRELIKWKPDIIHSQCEFFSFQYAKRISKKTGAPIVHTYHTLYEQYVTYVLPSRRLGKYLVRIFSRCRLKTAKCVIAPTHKVKYTLLQYGLKNKICVIPSGISLDQHKIKLTKSERDERRVALGFDKDNFVMVNLGRLGAEKNLEELITFFAKASSCYSELRFLIVGDGPAKESLIRLSERLGIASRIHFTGMVSPNEVQKHYRLGDLFVSASTSETQGLTYIEAAANGLPLLCRDDLCLKDVLIQDKNGLYYQDEDSFIKALAYIIKNPKWRSEAGAQSERIANLYDKSIFAKAVEKLYFSVICA